MELMMKKQTLCFFCVALCSLASKADQVELPHTFVAGSKAVAAEVNENFSQLAQESNAQDQRITALEAQTRPVVSDQLVCNVGNPYWITSGFAYDCIQTSDVDTVRNMTFKQIINEGWVVESFGDLYLFSK